MQAEDFELGGVLFGELQERDGLTRAQVHPAQRAPARSELDIPRLLGVLFVGAESEFKPPAALDQGSQVDPGGAAALRERTVPEPKGAAEAPTGATVK